MSFDINQYTEYLRAIAAKARADHEHKQAAQARHEPKRKLDYVGTVTAWWKNQPPKTREHPWSLKIIVAAAFADSPRKPSIQHVADALRRIGFTEYRDWTVAGRNRRYWIKESQ
jgi:hypothetical protein